MTLLMDSEIEYPSAVQKISGCKQSGVVAVGSGVWGLLEIAAIIAVFVGQTS